MAVGGTSQVHRKGPYIYYIVSHGRIDPGLRVKPQN